MSPTKAQLLWMYGTMAKARYYEDTMAAAYMEGKTPKFDIGAGPVPGEMHLAAGQEPCAAGVCVHLHPEDTVTATHRPHHIAIAKGVDLNKMTAEIFGKATGLGGGRGGHMHLFDPKVNFGCSGIIAEGTGPAVGAALAAKMRKTGAVAVAFLGEGAANQGAFHEAVNLAAVWHLPAIFVIEDNAWAISVPKKVSAALFWRNSSCPQPGTASDLKKAEPPRRASLASDVSGNKATTVQQAIHSVREANFMGAHINAEAWTQSESAPSRRRCGAHHSEA